MKSFGIKIQYSNYLRQAVSAPDPGPDPGPGPGPGPGLGSAAHKHIS